MNVVTKLRSDQRGVAFIEFALALPLFLVLMTGGIELGNMLLINVKTERLARSLSDIVARQSGDLSGMSERQFNDIIFAGTRGNSGLTLDKNGRVVVTAVLGEDANGDGVPEKNAIKWQRFSGGYVQASIILGCWSKVTAAVLPKARQLVANEPLYHVQVTQQYSPMLRAMFAAMNVPTEVTQVAMFRSRGSTFRPMLTTIGEPVHDKCDTSDGL